MKKLLPSLLISFFVTGIIFWIFFKMTPHFDTDTNVGLSEFSVKRASKIIYNIAQKPHFIGSENHKTVRDYLISELQNMGLEPTIQSGFTLTESGNLANSFNIVVKIKGSKSKKALLLLSHYDSAPHSKSKGASDDGAGIATILEGIRAFLHNKTPHKNDIIILFSDAEEFGLNGAALFVTQHKWAKEVGLAINFEARGSSGPSYMLMEVNAGNSNLISEFSKANVGYPNANSLMYSIYKMLPNDTDLTVFRENGNIQGLNFAFIDDHFNYHTKQDDFEHLDQKSLAHNGSYLMPLLTYFSNSDLENLENKSDFVYFNTPFNFIKYPFTFIFPMTIAAISVLVILLFVGFGKRILDLRLILKGLFLFFVALLLTGISTYFIWEIIKIIYPQYNEILHGFTYNGHYYILAFLFFTLSILFFIYRKKITDLEMMNYAIAPIFVWILINIALANYLKGAAFFIIPVFSSLIGLGFFIITQKSNKIINLIVIIPALIIFVPLIYAIPVGLGLKILYATMLFVAMVFGLMLPVFASFYKKRNWSIVMLIVAIGFFVQANVNSDFEYGKAKPNSLVYIFDADSKTANWATYDTTLDNWTKVYFNENSKNDFSIEKNNLNSKYGSKYSFVTKAKMVIIQKPIISFLKDSIIGNFRHLKIKIESTRKVNRYDIYSNSKTPIFNLRANGVQHINQKNGLFERNGNLLLSYLITNNQPLEMSFSIPKNEVLDLSLSETSFDLLEYKSLKVAKRPLEMMPKPFVVNDAIILKMKIEKTITKPKAVILKPIYLRKSPKSPIAIDTLNQ